jgi:hypothetical protein
MDSRCRHCGEPFDLDEFHGGDYAWSTWVKAFKNHGCGAVDALFDGMSPSSSTKCTREPTMDEETMDKINIVHDLLGDDYDGACSMLEDL